VPAPRPFRFAVSAHTARSRKAWRQFARKAETLGMSAVLMPDHFNDQLAPMPALAAAAETTKTLRVGPLVLCNDYKHPAVHAKELATLDLLSAGRVEWGMGAGWFPSDYTTTGLVMDPPGVRVDRLIESVRIMKGLFGPDAVTTNGVHYQLDGLDGTPKPVQKPHPPLLVGGSRPRMLAFAAREANMIGLGPNPDARTLLGRPPLMSVRDGVDRQLEWIRSAAGTRFDDLELQAVLYPVAVGVNAEDNAARLGPLLGLEPDEVLASPHVLLGTVDRICERLEERRERWGISYWVIPAAALDDFAPIVERMAGT
jgi:probable F420-dependent oxidoreductase